MPQPGGAPRLKRWQRSAKTFPASLVLIHAGLGKTDSAFEALERMAAEKDPRVGIYLTYPELASLRADPRMGAFRRRLGLQD